MSPESKRPSTYPLDDPGTANISVMEVVVPLSTYQDSFVDVSGAWTHCITTLSESTRSTSVSSAKALSVFLGGDMNLFSQTWVQIALKNFSWLPEPLLFPLPRLSDQLGSCGHTLWRKGRIKLPQTHIFPLQSLSSLNSQLEVAYREAERLFPQSFQNLP